MDLICVLKQIIIINSHLPSIERCLCRLPLYRILIFVFFRICFAYKNRKVVLSVEENAKKQEQKLI